MKNELIIEGNEVFSPSWYVAQGFEVRHETIKRVLIRKKMAFETHGNVRSCANIDSKKRGQKHEGFLLNLGHIALLTTFLKSSERIDSFKLQLTQEFVARKNAMDALILAEQKRQRRIEYAIWKNKSNPVTQEIRTHGKTARRKQTDAFQRLQIKAASEGSKNLGNPLKCYKIISAYQNRKMYSPEILALHAENKRDLLDGFGLRHMEMSDFVMEKAAKESLDQGSSYKEAWVHAKAKLDILVQATGVISIDHVPQLTQQAS